MIYTAKRGMFTLCYTIVYGTLIQKLRNTADCSTRAIVTCVSVSYDDALDLQLNEVKKSYYNFSSREVMEGVLKHFGYVKMKQPRKPDRTKYKVKRT